MSPRIALMIAATALCSAAPVGAEPPAGLDRMFSDAFDQDRGDGEAGSLRDVLSLRAEFDRRDPVEENNRHLMPFAELSRRDVGRLDDLRETRLPPRNLDLRRIPGTGRINWNSASGVLASQQFLKTNHLANWPMPERTACVAPDVMIDCCSYVLTEGNDGSGMSTQYYDPRDLYANEASAVAALREIYAQLPIFLPFTNGKVQLWHGWIYNGAARNPHGSLDYGKPTVENTDSGFRVRSVAPGTVVAKYWDSWHGNVLVIEHPGPGDFAYRSFYFHLRNGKTNDIALAKSRTTATGDSTASPDKYLKFADLPNPSDLHWGTDSQAIPVDVGDTVGAQQFIGWSGNTGPGGAGAGLKQDGTPSNATGANNHLHFMLAASHPTWTGGEWLYVDPYGVFEQQSTGCYDLLQPTEFDRLFAPYYPYFHGVQLGIVNFYLYYYGQMGLLPTTFSVQRRGGDVIAAGAFKSGFGSGWYLFNYMTPGDFQSEFNTLTNAANNFRLVDSTVSLDGASQRRYNGIFLPDTVNNWSSYGNQTVGDYVDTFDTLTGQGQDMIDFFAFRDGAVDRVASIFAPVPGGFSHYGLLTSSEFKNLTNDLADSGWLPVDVNVMEWNNGTWLSAIYRQTGDSRMVHWGMTAIEYQQWMDFYLSNGWDLEVVQNYAGGNRYAAIWSL